jgi:FkbM family methyltransferase
MDFLRKILFKPVKDILRPVYYGFLGLLRFLVRISARCVSAVMGKKWFLKLSHFIRREIDTNLVVNGIIFDATNYIPFTRAVSLLTKEPDMIAWIDEYVREGDVFYDIGANVGIFSLYAAKKRGAKVIAFEPFAGNYVLLNRNIYLNDLSDNVTALNIALHDKTILSHLNVSKFWAGKAGHSFVAPVGSRGKTFEPNFLQGVIGMSCDDLIETFDLPFPTHIKIDVDGNEPFIFAGMEKTLADPRLNCVAIEINNDLPEHVNIVEQIKGNGFKCLDEERFINRADLDMGNVQNYFLVREN